MKILKIAGAVLLAAVVIYFIACLFGPKEFKTSRSTTIHAPANVVFTNLSDYRNWEKWSPWRKYDTLCKYEYSQNQGQADAFVKWDGNKNAGQGEMRTIEIAQDKSLAYIIHFIKPMESQAKGAFTLDDAGNGETKVTWAFESQFGFLSRALMLFYDMEKMIGNDYENGLANLKAVCESPSSAGAAVPVVAKANWTTKTYVAYRTQTTFDGISDVFMKWMPKVYEYVQENKMEIDGPVVGIYYTWDTEKKTTDMAVGIPVRKADKVSGDFKLLTVDASEGVVSDYYGAYDKMGPAHENLQKFIKDHNLKKKAPVIEEYVTDPGTEKDTSKILTRIYYFTE